VLVIEPLPLQDAHVLKVLMTLTKVNALNVILSVKLVLLIQIIVLFVRKEEKITHLLALVMIQ
jgi:hypothetical protein